MNDNATAAAVHPPPCGPRRRLRRAGSLGVAAALITLAATACADPGSPAPVAPRTSPSSAPRQVPGATRCTPQPGQASLPSTPSACDSTQPAAAPPTRQGQALPQPGQSLPQPGQSLPGRTSQPIQSLQSELLKYVKCMRTHGITNFPYPSAQGGGRITINSDNSIDTSSAQFQNAQQACQSLLSADGDLP
jgi:hypothetical protein